MKLLMAARALVAFCVTGLSYGLMPDNPEDRERFALLKMIEYCDLLVRGARVVGGGSARATGDTGGSSGT